jgi:hypothetical protein
MLSSDEDVSDVDPDELQRMLEVRGIIYITYVYCTYVIFDKCRPLLKTTWLLYTISPLY